MADTVLSIGQQALLEIGAIGIDLQASPLEAALVLDRFTRQMDAWNADGHTIATPAVQQAATITAGTTTLTIGPGGQINTVRPVWITEINYVIPGSSPEVETPMGQMDKDSFAPNTIKLLQSQLPTLWYYNAGTPLGTLQFWPEVTQNIKIYLYLQQGVGVPASLYSTVVGPPGYSEAFLYQLALRLCNTFGRPVPSLLETMATDAYARMKRPNIQPPLMGVDQALVPPSGAGAYNILNDTSSGSRGR